MKNIFETYEYQNLKIKNRIVRAATNDYSGGSDGSISQIQIDLYKELARNNIGLIITGNFYVSENGRLDGTQNSITELMDNAGAKFLTSAIHSAGSKVVFQIAHAGSKTKINKDAAKAYSDVNTLSTDELQVIVKDFVAAVKRSRECMADGVQIHFGHGYLLCELLSKREDGLFIAEDILHMARKENPDYPILVKVNSDIDESTLISFCLLCQKYGVWAIELSGQDFMKKKAEEHNYYKSAINLVKKNCSVPVILTGGIRSIEDSNEALNMNADLVGMSRPFISEPDLINRWKDQSSRCISCCKCFDLYKNTQKRCVFMK